MANVYFTSRDYTKPAIDQRIAQLVKRRIGAREDLPTESTKERLVSTFVNLMFFPTSLNIHTFVLEYFYIIWYNRT